MSPKGGFQFNVGPSQGARSVPADVEAKLLALEERAEAKGNAVGGQPVEIVRGARGRPRAPVGAQRRPLSPPEDTSDRLRVRSRDGQRLVRKSLRLPEQIVEQLEAYCEQERWSAAEVVAQALGEFFAQTK